MKPSTKLQIMELCFMVLIIIKQSFNAVFATTMGLSGILAFIILSNYLGFNFNISLELVLNLVGYIFFPTYWIVNSVSEINEYINSKKK